MDKPLRYLVACYLERSQDERSVEECLDPSNTVKLFPGCWVTQSNMTDAEITARIIEDTNGQIAITVAAIDGRLMSTSLLSRDIADRFRRIVGGA
jgi:hypothetical protein